MNSHGDGVKVTGTDVADRLRRQSRRMTAPRQAVLDALRRHDHPLSIKEIFAALTNQLCDLVTVYRSMHLLEEMRVVNRFDFGDGVARYELAKEGDDGHHHHLICTSCAVVIELDDCFPHELQQRIASHNGFKAVTHRLEFFGLCPRCQDPTPSRC